MEERVYSLVVLGADGSKSASSVYIQQQHAFMAEAGIDSLKISQSANEETGADEEQERPRHLSGDECGGETAT